MALLPRKALERVRPAVHGGPDFAELKQWGITPDSLLDFSVGFNPLGIPPGLKEKVAAFPFDSYPDAQAMQFREALARKLGVTPENIIAGNGSSELIWLCCLAYFGSRDKIVIAGPTFGEYERAGLIGGSVPVAVNSRPPDFKVNVEALIQTARRRKARGIFLCNPNNPTGAYLTQREVEGILDSLPDTLVVLDEAYVAFTDGAWPSEPLVSRPNVVVLRSMTKDYGLAGLRLGYTLAAPEIISNLRKVCPPWNVNSLAQHAGIMALNEDQHVRRGYEIVRQAKDYLYARLRELGLAPVPSATNFFLVKVGNAGSLRQALLRKGILVRDCSSFGLPEYIRLAARPIADCQRLVEALQALGDRN